MVLEGWGRAIWSIEGWYREMEEGNHWRERWGESDASERAMRARAMREGYERVRARCESDTLENLAAGMLVFADA